MSLASPSKTTGQEIVLSHSCPLCAAPAAQQSLVVDSVYGDETGRAVFSCGACDVRYLYPGLSAEEERKFYAAEFEKFMAKRSAPSAGWEGPERHVAANEGERLRRMGHLAGILKPKSRILEVGCGSGFLLFPLKAAGHSCVAVEPSGVFSDYVRSRDVPCYPSVEAMGGAGEARQGFDLIVHYYVMEHLADPVAFLKQLIGMLRPGGRIVLEVPNANDALTALYQIPAYERFIWVVSHRWYFTEKSLAFAIEKAGGRADIRLDQRYDLSNHLVWARDGKPGGAGRFTEVLGQELEDSYRQALIQARICDTLIGVVSAI